MHNQLTLSTLKNHHDLNSTPKGLIHISPNITYIDAILGKIGKYIEEDFYVNSAENTGQNASIIHYDGENYTLDYSGFAYPHFGVIQTIKRLLKPRYSFFLYQPLLSQNIYALLIVKNTELESFISKDGFWFDQHFARLEDGFDGFSQLNKNTPLPTTEPEARARYQARQEQSNPTDSKTPEKKKSKYPFWSALGFADPVPAGDNDDPAYDFARREYNKKHTHNGMPVAIVLLLLLAIAACGSYMYYIFSVGDGSWAHKMRSWDNWKSESALFQSDVPTQIEEASLEQYVGKMIAVKGGSFEMGSEDEKLRYAIPVHTVTLPDFKIMETEVTFEQWQACVADGACTNQPSDEGWGKQQHPVINISYNDIVDEYIPWLYQKTGYQFELPSEAQWEYAARGGTTSDFVFGEDISCEDANWGHYGNHRSYYDKYCGGNKADRKTMPVKSYGPNAYGLYDMYGNVGEMVNDLYHDSYAGAPADGSAWEAPSAGEIENVDYHSIDVVLRGGDYSSSYHMMKAASRSEIRNSKGNNRSGFRLVLKN
ncbi:formylglycine-generating enzyme family protein [Reichenbachiella ulvae]|uniref:Formylglycine-generating enzyme family protein n=1 Tax=Reichenbachiella ulvae TaxID=2980104 RepID=A0ABT3CPF7_9BACT|nr:formylglycine-generating enzyme family protein [Reichenbachiella ulvae]MCV9385616.1 formylglycine-generating enzyme family protein [Reichenbachiella ulvae]